VAELLIEIGLEEIPAPWLAGLGDQLASQLQAAAEREFLEPHDVRALWAPRRLVLSAQVLPQQKDREERTFGPPVKAARTPDGAWTPAAIGFARKNGCRPEDLTEGFKEGAADPYVVSTRTIAGRPAVDVLGDVLATTLRSLSFPKRMSWDAWLEDGKGAFTFGRPIRWLVALLDGRIVPFTIFEMTAGGERGRAIVEAGNASRGHRFLPRGRAGEPIQVRSLANLISRLRKHAVLLDPAERETRIQQALVPHLPRIRDDHGLPAEWRDLVEMPTVVFGTIPTEFRSLPTEVLETVLVHHQKYIPITNEGGGVDRFAAVVNTDDENAAEIVRGMERVVVARLRDAAFFFAEDRKRLLADRVDDLAGVTFHRGLGSYADKTARVEKLIDVMGPEQGLLTRAEHEGAREAARLAKADLTTLMVREFPELQGTMGAIYLRAEGNPRQDVIRAVQWHYHPLSAEEGSAPAGRLHGSDATVFGAVSLADKLDTLAGYFGLGMVPTGSSDPYGLRRAGQGAVRVLLDFWSADGAERRPSLRRLIPAAVAGHSAFAKRSTEAIVADLEAFLLDRLRAVLLLRGMVPDEVDAVLGARDPDPLGDPHECLPRLDALHRVRSAAAEDFEHLAVAFKRAKNILGDGPHPSVDPSLFEQDAERALHAAAESLRDEAAADGEGRLRALAQLRGPVDTFFDTVLVMAEDERVRANRLALLDSVLALFYRVADISRLGA